MKRLVLVTALFLLTATAAAHPAVSVVIDSHGNAYYSDLAAVWRVTPSGAKSVVMRNVHSHELYIDSRDNLYGEHLWYEGDASKKWGHFVWKRRPDGLVEHVMPQTEGFLRNYSFQRDAAGNMYWPDRDRNEIIRTASDGKSAVFARGNFRDIRWMTVTKNGVVYLIDKLDLLRVTPGRVTTVVPNITTRGLMQFVTAERHMLMGLWTDPRGNVYVADAGHGVVKKVDAAGRTSVILKSKGFWFPAGGAFAPNGDLWLLEWTLTNQVRLRRLNVPH